MPRREGRRIWQLAIVCSACLAVLLVIVLTTSTNGAPGRPNGQDLRQQLAVPAYMSPTQEAGSWAQLIGSRPGTVGIVVANVDSGPGTQPVPAWASVIRKAHAAGIKVLGYVDTGYLGRPFTGHPDGLLTRSGGAGLGAWTTQIEADVDAWYRFYGSDVDGVYFDQGTDACGPTPSSHLYADEYESLSRYVKEAHPGALTALSPGTAVPQCYRNSADVLVTFEGSYEDYTGTSATPSDSYRPLSWTPVDPDRIWNIVYGAATQREMNSAVALSKSRNVGYIYVTNGARANPYGSIPSLYWKGEQEQTLPR